MKKQLKYILITLVAALVLGLGVLAAVLFVPDAPDDSSSMPASQRVYVYEKNAADIVKMTVTNQHGSFELTPKDSGNFHIKELDSYRLVQSYMNSLASTYASLSARKLVTEAPEDLSLYGFDEPLASASIEFKDETVTVIIGNAEPTTNGYYCKLGDSDKVYLLNNGVGSRLLASKLYYVDRQITPMYDTTVELAFDKVVLSGSVRDKEIVIVPTPDNEDDTYAEIFGYQIISPANAPFDLTAGNDFLTSFFIMAADVVEVLSPDEETLRQYGFDNPYSVAEIHSSSGNFTVTVGKLDGEYCYVMNDTDDVIFKCLASSVNWLESQYQDLVSTIFLVPHINLVGNVDIVTPDKEYNYTITYNEENDVIFAKCGSKTVNTENFQKLYQVLVSCYLENYSTERPDGEPTLTITYTFHEGGTERLELYPSPSDPRQSIIKYNDSFTDFKVRTVWVDKVIADCERLLNGQEISTSW